MKPATALLLASLLLVACHRERGKEAAGDGTAPATTSQPALTEGQAVGAIIQATQALAIADSTAAANVSSPGINLYAAVLRTDHRAIAAEVRAAADSAKVAPAQSPVGDRLKAEADAIVAAASDSTADSNQAYLAAQVEVQKHLIGALDSTVMPVVRTPQLRQVLQDLRPAMVAHLQRGEQLVRIFAAEQTAPRQSAARISPDSARAPGDTTGDTAANRPVPAKPDTLKPPVRPDTLYLR